MSDNHKQAKESKVQDQVDLRNDESEVQYM